MNLSLDRRRVEDALRKATSNSISIPALRGRYIWLNETLPEPRRGSIVFEAKATNDIHICLHYDNSKTIFGKDGRKEGAPEYEFLIGGWANSKSSIRKFSCQQIFVTKDMKKDVVIRTSSVFSKYWITIINDTIYAGIGELGYNEILQWKDEESSNSDIRYIGVSSWNAPIQFKNFLITKPYIPDHQKFTFNGKYLLNSSILSDMEVTVGNKSFFLHSAVVYCWNPNFKEDVNNLLLREEEEKKLHELNKKETENERKELISEHIFDLLLNIMYSGRICSTDLNELEEILILSQRLNISLPFVEQYHQSLSKEIYELKKAAQIELAKLDIDQTHTLLEQESINGSDRRRSQTLIDLRIMELTKELDKKYNNSLEKENTPNQIKDNNTPSPTCGAVTLEANPELAENPLNEIKEDTKSNNNSDSETEPKEQEKEVAIYEPDVTKLNTVLKEIAHWSDSMIISRVIRFSSVFGNPLYSDVEFIFESGDKSIMAHRAILSFLSDPFLAMFSNQMLESTQKKILLREVSYRSFLIFLEYCYKGHIEIPVEHVISLLMLSDRFGINSLRESCFEIVNEYIDLENCCNLLDMANLYNWTIIKSNCVRFIQSNFNRICEREEFLFMNPNTLIRLLLSDDLLVSDEYLVFLAAMKWIEHNCPNYLSSEASEDELQLVSDILSFVRYPLVQENLLLEIKHKYSQLLEIFPKINAYIDEALDFIQEPYDVYPKSPNNAIELTVNEKIDFRKRNRTANNFNELLYTSYGDKNGVFYFIGCAYGTKKIWENPHKANRVRVTMSSPVSRYTRPEILLNRSFISTNYTSGNPAWCKVDLGENHQLVCNYYTIRQDGSDCFLRNWILQGSNSDDEENFSWVNLRVHKKEKTLFQPGQYAGWPVFGRNARTPYRWFRIITTGPSAGYNGNAHKLAICSLELYGYFK